VQAFEKKLLFCHSVHFSVAIFCLITATVLHANKYKTGMTINKLIRFILLI